MKYLYFLVFCFLFSFYSHAQSFFEKGAVWHYTYESFQWLAINQIATISAHYNNDTTINSISCQEIVFEGVDIFKWSFYLSKTFIYQKDSAVYFWEDRLKTFSMLYNFSVKKDSSWKIDYFDEAINGKSNVFVRVDSIGTRILLGRKLNSRFVTYSRDSLFQNNVYSSEIVEKIGDLNWMFN